MRICFVDYWLDPRKPGRSGLSDLVWDMATELVRQGHEAHIVASYHTDRYPDNRAVVHNFPTPPIGYRNIVGQFWILHRAAKLVRQLAPDVVHAPEYVSTAVLDTLGITAPLVVSPPGNIYQWLAMGNNIYERHFTEVLKWAAKRSARRCTRVVASSSTMEYWWRKTGTPAARLIRIPLGVDGSRFTIVPSARERLKVPSDCLLLVYVGRLSPEKGVHDLIGALAEAQVRAGTHNVRLEIVGDGPQRAELENLAAHAGLDSVVQFRGWVEPNQLPVWYSAADAVFVPSHHEAFGRIIGEAMICGTPVVASGVGGAADHIEDGLNGYLFPAGERQALTAILSRILKDPAAVRKLRPAAKHYAEQHLSWANIVRQLVDEVYVPTLAGMHADTHVRSEAGI